MKTTVHNVSEPQIEKLCQEAAQAGDQKTVDLGQVVLNRQGSKLTRSDARAECARIIRDAELCAMGAD